MKIQSADGYEMTLDEAIQTIFDYNALRDVRIEIKCEVGDTWGEVREIGTLGKETTIAEVHAEYSLAEALVSIAAQIEKHQKEAAA